MARATRRSAQHWYGLLSLMALVFLLILAVVWEFHQPKIHNPKKAPRPRRSTRKLKPKLPEVIVTKPPTDRWPYAEPPEGQAEFEELESPVLVLAYNELPWTLESPLGCEVRCNVTYDRGELRRADAVLFTAPMLDHETLEQYEKPPEQTWIALCMGAHSDRECRRVHADLGGRIDMIASYKPGADISAYFYVPTPNLLWRPTPEIRKPELVSLLSSTCVREKEPERFDLLSSVLRHLDGDGVASYGECFHNKDLPFTVLKS